MTVFKIFLFIFLNLVVTFAKISDKRLCFNKDCSEPVSIAKTLLGYISDDSRILSFKPNQEVKIFSKSAGSRLDLWGAEIKGKRGYVPISHIRENRIFRDDLKFLIDTEGEADPAFSSSAPKTVTEIIPTDKNEKIEIPKPAENEISPNTVTPTYEIIDGTTLYLTDSSDYSSTPPTITGNLVDHSEKHITEHVTEATIPVVLDTKKIIENVNPEQKQDNGVPNPGENISLEKQSKEEKTVKSEETLNASIENQSEEKIYDLSEEQKRNNVDGVPNSSENISSEKQSNEKLIGSEETKNSSVENKSEEITSKEHKENKVDDVSSSSENISSEKQELKEKIVKSEETKNSSVENKSEEITSKEQKEIKVDDVPSSSENISSEKQESKEKIVKSEETRNSSVENKSEEISKEQKENKVDDVPNSSEHISLEKQESKEKITESAEKINSYIENKSEEKNDLTNSSENISSEKQESTEEKIIDSVKTVNVNFENKSAEVTNEVNEELEDGDDDEGEDDEEEEEEEEDEEVPENPETPVKQDIPNAQGNKIITSTNEENADVKSTEDTSNIINENSGSITSEHERDSDNSSIETSATENLNENTKQSDMNQFNAAANNETSNTFENNSANADESAGNNEQKIEPGVPSLFPNPLKIFASREIPNENTQVPESNNAAPASSETRESNEQFSVTTETPIDQDGPLPLEDLTDSFTENPSVLLNDKTPEFIEMQHDSSIKQSEFLKDISSDFSFENSDIGIGSVEEMSPNSVIGDQTSENSQSIENIQNSSENASDEPGFFSNLFSNLFGSKPEESSSDDDPKENTYDNVEDRVDTEGVKQSWTTHVEENPSEKYLISEQSDMQSCKAGPDTSCPLALNQNFIRSENGDINWSYEIPENAYTILLYLTLTAITVLLFSLGYYYIEKRRKDGKLIASINELEKKLLVTTKECQLAQNELKITKEKLESVEDTSCDSTVALETLKEELETVKCTKQELEEQIANLEIELEKATETGMEMSQMLNELLTSQSGNEHLMKTINGLQKQLNDQKITLNHTQTKLSEKNTENELLRTELQVTNEKVSHLQAELDKMVVNILSVQEEKSKIENDYEAQIEKLTTDHDSISTQLNKELGSLKEQIKKYNTLIEETKRELDIKSNEYDLLKQSMKDIEVVQSNKESMKALLDVSHVKAEVLQLREEKHKLSDKLQKEIEAKMCNEKEVQVMLQEVKILKDKFDEAEKEKVEAETRLEVLSSYFKEREAQYQKEINENESKWMQKEGEATSTIERIKWIQEELQNYKSQNELLKKEILDQEVSLKSQISMLEKKNHENWLLTRQAERKLEESKQEASQLRNRLTIVEKNLNNSSQMNEESMIQNHSNGDVAVSPLHMTNAENPGSPPLLFPHRDHMTTSPPLQVLPPFMPPPHGVHFMPPPPLSGVPPFMPPPPPLFPGDHRPPPLGRMSSPPLHGRYSPDSRTYSPYDRDDSPPMSPTYTDDYRRRSPPPPNVNHLPPRNYSPYSGGKQRYWDDKMEYRGQQQHHRNKSRPHKGLSSGSGNSDESLENSGRHSGRV